MSARPLARQLALAWGAAAVAGLALLPWAGQLAGSLPACPLRAATGWPCPACGSGRAVLALASGAVPSALRSNLLFVLGAATFVGGGIAAAIGELRGRPLAEPRALPLWSRLALSAALLAQWIHLIVTGR